MNEIVFTRILGHDETQEGHYWVDTNQCLYCEKWNMITIKFHPQNDRKYFSKKRERMEKLMVNIQNLVRKSIEDDGMWDEVIDDIDELEELGKMMNKSMAETLRSLPEVSEKAASVIEEESKESEDEDELLD